MVLRIKGLVSQMNRVRAMLARGIEPGDREDFRENVRTLVWQVEDLCLQHGRSPEDLPGPSRNAYRFFRDLDLENLPELRPGDPGPEPRVGVSGVVGIGRELARRMWTRSPGFATDSDAFEDLLHEIQGHAAAIEDICGSQDGTPAGLASPSRRVYAWLKFLSEEANLRLHIDGLSRAGRITDPPDEPESVREVRLVNLGSLYRIRRGEEGAVIHANEGFSAAPDDVWRALRALAVTRGARGARSLVRAFAETDEYAEIVLEMEAHALPTGSSRGRHHDLDASFDRVNEALFGGDMLRPRLVWNRVPTSRKLGHYQRSSDTVMLSVTLDDPEVPEFVVDCVMHHELLHKRLGARWENGRRIVHGPMFRAMERRFPRFDEAEKALAALIRARRSPG